MFSGLLTSIVNTSNHTKSMSLSNQKRMTQPNLIKLHPNELYYYLLQARNILRRHMKVS